jgi:hypothetical protein
MEFGLSHSLGRPCCYSVTHDNVDVKFFEMVDDRYITTKGIIPGAKPVLSKCISIHFLKMRLLQLEVRRVLYLNRREAPVDDQDPWFTQMLAKVDHWMESCPKNDDGSGLNVKWYVHCVLLLWRLLTLGFFLYRFEGRRNTMICLIHRPTPQIPEPSVNAAKVCYDAAVFNIAMHKEQTITGSVDLTWIFTQSLFMVLNTVLWTLSYPEIRKDHPIEEVQGYLDMALEVIVYAAERWPGVQSALLLYRRLVVACLKAYQSEESFVVHSPSNHPTPTSSQDVMTPPAMSSPSSTTTASFYSQGYRYNGMPSTDDSPSTGTLSRGHSADPTVPFPQGPQQPTPPVYTTDPVKSTLVAPAPIAPTFGMQPPPSAAGTGSQFTSHDYCAPDDLFSDIPIDPTTPYNSMPSGISGLQGWDPHFSLASTTASHLAYINAAVDPMQWTASISDQYSQYFNEPFPTESWRERTLSQQEQIELMASLEQNIPDVSAQLVRESHAFYQS